MSRYGTIAVAASREGGGYEVLARGEGEDFEGNGLAAAKGWIKDALPEGIDEVKIIREVDDLGITVKTKRVIEFEDSRD